MKFLFGSIIFLLVFSDALTLYFLIVKKKYLGRSWQAIKIESMNPYYLYSLILGQLVFSIVIILGLYKTGFCHM